MYVLSCTTTATDNRDKISAVGPGLLSHLALTSAGRVMLSIAMLCRKPAAALSMC